MEAVKNLLGISYFPDYGSYGDLNIRKFQMLTLASLPDAPVAAAAPSATPIVGVSAADDASPARDQETE